MTTPGIGAPTDPFFDRSAFTRCTLLLPILSSFTLMTRCCPLSSNTTWRMPSLSYSTQTHRSYCQMSMLFYHACASKYTLQLLQKRFQQRLQQLLTASDTACSLTNRILPTSIWIEICSISRHTNNHDQARKQTAWVSCVHQHAMRHCQDCTTKTLDAIAMKEALRNSVCMSTVMSVLQLIFPVLCCDLLCLQCTCVYWC
jgi:hypothetical protein